MNILFYTPVNFRCRDIESLGKEYSKRGHRVFLLSQCAEGAMHESFRKLGMTSLSQNKYSRIALICMIKQVIHLAKFCKKNNIDLVFSHLEPTNFVSVIVQYFISTKIIIYRHHINEARLYDFDKSITYRATYSLAQTIICVSRQAKDYMIEEEKVPKEKIHHINLGYDFSLYSPPKNLNVERIRSESPSGILLVSVGRLTKFKRPEIAVELVREANLKGVDTSILFLGVGEEEEPLRNLAKNYSIQDKVIFVGYTVQILDYLVAADLLIHPSILESSCVVIKEAALVELPVIVCKGVGDFDDYMKNEINGVVLEKEKFAEDAFGHLKRYLVNRNVYRAMGIRLKEEILSRFSIDRVFGEYSKFNRNN